MGGVGAMMVSAHSTRCSASRVGPRPYPAGKRSHRDVGDGAPEDMPRLDGPHLVHNPVELCPELGRIPTQCTSPSL
jgi:hypothetical protein